MYCLISDYVNILGGNQINLTHGLNYFRDSACWEATPVLAPNVWVNENPKVDTHEELTTF